jgi:hypothetical protein
MSSTAWEPAFGGPTLLVAERPAPQAARLVQLCCQRLLVVESEFASAFHQELCGLIPHALPALPSAATLSGALAHCVLWAALTRDRADVVEDGVRAFAAGQHALGFPDGAYGSFSHALLRAVRATLPAGWTSEMSSCWVSYALWLQPHLELGASSMPGGNVRPTDGAPASLDVIFERLRAQYFGGQDRQLMAICTRVMLRTGADLRAPRPEQRTDPGTIAAVEESLLLMGFGPAGGYASGNGTSGSSLPAPVPAPAVSAHAGAGADQRRSGRRRHWWAPHRRRADGHDPHHRPGA